MFFRKSKLIRELRKEIQRLRELLAETIGARNAYREQAREAIGLATENQFPQGPHNLPVPRSRLWQRCEVCAKPTLGALCSPECCAIHATQNAVSKGLFPPEFRLGEYLPDHKGPEVKHCPECSVSVRSDSWPQECPACHCTFGFSE